MGLFFGSEHSSVAVEDGVDSGTDSNEVTTGGGLAKGLASLAWHQVGPWHA